jgi:uncharacterized protein (DUF2267 family)
MVADYGACGSTGREAITVAVPTLSRATRALWQGSLTAAAVTSARVFGRRRTVRGIEQLSRWLRDTHGLLQGVDYRVRGRGPGTGVSDRVLADRLRTRLGPVTRQLDLPHMTVEVADGVAVLHGDVADGAQADVVVSEARQVPGIVDVDAHVHICLSPSDTRPSTSQRHASPSHQLTRLEQAARATGVEVGQAAVVLQVLLQRLPAGERAHVVNHLRADVRQLVDGVRVPDDVLHVRDVDKLVEIAGRIAGLSNRRARGTLEAVMIVLAELVPEEGADILAVLPGELRELWIEATTADD